VKEILQATLAAVALATVVPANAFDPLSLAGSAVSTALDVRSKTEVKNDVEIEASLTKKLLEARGDDFKDVSVLVFAQHAVLVGYAKSEEARHKAEALAKADKRIRSLKNDIVIGSPTGNMAGNLVVDKKIGVALTAAKGVHSVNMRWKVYGGEVFLMGVAKSKGEADLVVAKIRGVDGVKSVRSQLRIGKK
jgi:osmotically-inducible protein OsmY